MLSQITTFHRLSLLTSNLPTIKRTLTLWCSRGSRSRIQQIVLDLIKSHSHRRRSRPGIEAIENKVKSVIQDPAPTTSKDTLPIETSAKTKVKSHLISTDHPERSSTTSQLISNTPKSLSLNTNAALLVIYVNQTPPSVVHKLKPTW